MTEIPPVKGPMAKKQKERSEVEYLRSIVREQKSEIRNLKKQLSQKSKRVQNLEENSLDVAEYELEKESEQFEQPVAGCPNCRAPLIVSDLGVRILETCKCGYRKAVKKK
jgi:hypothetical protein